jgi:hypothetical protein
MMSPMDSPLMTFGLAKPSLQVQIVSRQLIERADKQSRQEAGHQGRHVLGERVLLPRELSAEFLKRTSTVLLRAVGRIERIGNGLDLLHPRPQFALNFLDGFHPAVDARR